MDNREKLDFSSILASSTHDMKNSLFMLLQSIELLTQDKTLTALQQKNVAGLHHQTSCINGTLMQLLALYRDENKQLPVYIEAHSVLETLHEVVEKQRLYLDSHDIEVAIIAGEHLQGYFDQDLIINLLADIFVNALRHCEKKIILSAFLQDQYLNIQIEDDGQGYPEQILANNGATDAENSFSDFSASKGRSGLGLLFARRIAAEHKNNHLQGHILLENKVQSNGSIFTLRLP